MALPSATRTAQPKGRGVPCRVSFKPHDGTLVEGSPPSLLQTGKPRQGASEEFVQGHQGLGEPGRKAGALTSVGRRGAKQPSALRRGEKAEDTEAAARAPPLHSGLFARRPLNAWSTFILGDAWGLGLSGWISKLYNGPPAQDTPPPHRHPRAGGTKGPQWPALPPAVPGPRGPPNRRGDSFWPPLPSLLADLSPQCQPPPSRVPPPRASGCLSFSYSKGPHPTDQGPTSSPIASS